MEFDIASLVSGDDNSYDDAYRARKRRNFRDHYRSERYQRPASSRSGVKAGLLDKPICALDGEGKNRANGRHDYTLMCAVWPAGRRCIEGHHLPAERCFDFILDLPDDHVYLGYGLSYDTNMWLLSLPNDIVDRLLDRTNARRRVRWKQYEIEWVERKYMTVCAYGKSRTVYDVLAFFQVPFVSPDPSIVKGACEGWNVGTAEQLEIVRLMKALRGKFENVEDERIKGYTYLECEMLGELMSKFIAAVKETGLKPRALYGPGALASAALEKNGVKRYMRELDEPVASLARVAYFGGRFDAALFGWLEDCYQFDIRSAYPHQIRSLPCLKHARFDYHTSTFDTLNPARYGLYHVEWNIDPMSHWGPFPHRTPNGLIFYPYQGAGWYHADEVSAAIEMFGTDAIKVLEGWELVPQCDHKPFAFVDLLYALRRQLETTGNHDQGIVIKLILNSLYGKLAQQVGMRKDKPPPFQCFFWAGAITGGTRAQILRAIAMDADKVISIATDGIVSLERLDLTLGDELGEWEEKILTEFAQLSNGVYHATTADGKSIDRARGLGRGVLNFSKDGVMYRQWKKSKGMGTYFYKGKTRFITHREARQRGNRNDIKCRWLDEQRSLDFAPKRRFPWPDRDSLRQDILRTRLLSYEDYGAPRESSPFRVKTDSALVHAKREEHFGTAWYDSA